MTSSQLHGAAKVAALSLIVTGGAVALAADGAVDPTAVVTPADVQWKPDPRGPGMFVAVVAGDPKQPGLYVVRVKMLAGAKLAPHRHPDLRSVTVLSGEFHLGIGETFDESKMKRYPAGSHILIPPDTPHYGAVKDGESIQQDCGWGPTGSTPVTASARK